MGGLDGRDQNLRLAFFAPAEEWDPLRSPSCPQKKTRGKMKMRVKRRCSVMPAHGPTAPPQISKLRLREDTAEQESAGS